MASLVESTLLPFFLSPFFLPFPSFTPPLPSAPSLSLSSCFSKEEEKKKKKRKNEKNLLGGEPYSGEEKMKMFRKGGKEIKGKSEKKKKTRSSNTSYITHAHMHVHTHRERTWKKRGRKRGERREHDGMKKEKKKSFLFRKHICVYICS